MKTITKILILVIIVLPMIPSMAATSLAPRNVALPIGGATGPNAPKIVSVEWNPRTVVRDNNAGALTVKFNLAEANKYLVCVRNKSSKDCSYEKMIGKLSNNNLLTTSFTLQKRDLGISIVVQIWSCNSYGKCTDNVGSNPVLILPRNPKLLSPAHKKLYVEPINPATGIQGFGAIRFEWESAVYPNVYHRLLVWKARQPPIFNPKNPSFNQGKGKQGKLLNLPTSKDGVWNLSFLNSQWGYEPLVKWAVVACSVSNYECNPITHSREFFVAVNSQSHYGQTFTKKPISTVLPKKQIIDATAPCPKDKKRVNGRCI